MANERLHVDREGIDFITQYEKLRLEPYLDQAGKLTVGWGHLILPHERALYPVGRSITREEADLLLAKDLLAAESAVKKHIIVSLTQRQFDALVSFVFNGGPGFIATGSVNRAVNAKTFDEVPDALMRYRYVHIDGKPVESAGLVRRRRDEGKLFASGAPQEAPGIPAEKPEQRLSPGWGLLLFSLASVVGFCGVKAAQVHVETTRKTHA